MKTKQKRLEYVIKCLTVTMNEALDRCEHCGKEGEVFDCEPCQETREQFANIISDLIHLIYPAPHSADYEALMRYMGLIELAMKR